MDWSGLTSNLVSEAIGILVSVLIIDRLLSWRETKRWLKVRELFFTFGYICGKEFSDDHACWKQLQQELSPPIGKLSDLVDRFSTMVDPEMALAVIRLSMDAENFQSGLYMDQQQRTPLMKAAFATMVVNGIRESISLKEFIRTERLKLDLRLRRKDLSKTWQNEKLEALQSPNLDS